MERNKHKGKVSAILTGDWHLRDSKPICRTDNFEEAQWEKVDYIAALQVKYNCPVYHSGDLYDMWKPSPFLLTETMRHLPKKFYTVYGNHDLPQHNLDLANKCGINVLKEAGKLQVLPYLHKGQIPENISLGEDEEWIAWHIYTYVGDAPYPGALNKAHTLFRRLSHKLILTGDNHTPFVVQWNGRLLVNPGSLTRQNAEQIDFEPRVYLWYEESNTVQIEYLPIRENVISREHLQQKELREERLSAFITSLNGKWKVGISFEDNIAKFERSNRVRKSVMEIIHKSMES